MAFHPEAIGGVVFLTLYTVNLSILIYGYATRRIYFKSVFTFLLLHVLLRLAAQAVSIAIGTRDTLDFGLLIAFFVLGAEGYFSLVLCSYRFVIHHHQHTYPISGSWLEGKPSRTQEGKTDPWYKRLLRALTARDKEGKKDPWVMTWIHWLMIAANVIIVIGGTRTNASEYGTPEYDNDMRIAGIMRVVGQAVFLVINLFLANFLLLSKKQDSNPSGTIPSAWARFFRVSPDHGAADVQQGRRNLDGYDARIHPTLRVLMLAWPPLILRGIFGLVQSQVDKINYSNVAAYQGFGTFTTLFIVTENVFAVLPEWLACCLLCSTMFTRDSWKPSTVHDDRAAQGEGRPTGARTIGSYQSDNMTLIDSRKQKEAV